MEETTKLIMYFKNIEGKQVSISVNDPKDTLTEDDIKTAMDLILEKDIFKKGSLSLVSTAGAKIVNTETTEYDLIIE